MITAADIRRGLDAQCSEEAVDAVVRATAHIRHSWRVSQTEEAAMAAASHMIETCCYVERTDTDTIPTVARFLLRAELSIGIGLSLGGPARSQRLLANLGKGRWKASDGPAWEAAAEEAIIRLSASIGAPTKISPVNGKIVLTKNNGATIVISVSDALGDTRNLLARVAVRGAAAAIYGKNYVDNTVQSFVPHHDKRMDLAAEWCACVPAEPLW